MASSFTNFLHNVGAGFLNSEQLHDYQHANRLFVNNNYERAPKVGFLYFVKFNLTTEANKFARTCIPGYTPIVWGLLAKKADLPKFTVATETLNQYNRKTVVQTKIRYNPVSIELHDDNRDLTNYLWVSYYRYYYGDSRTDRDEITKAYANTKWDAGDISDDLYGLVGDGVLVAPNGTVIPSRGTTPKYSRAEPYFQSIEIFVLHNNMASIFTLVNPLITDWTHDTVESADGGKTLSNKLTLAYESVHYETKAIEKGKETGIFADSFYDNTPSPLAFGAGGNIFGANGLLSGAGGAIGMLGSGNILGAAAAGFQVANNIKKVTGASIKNELSNMAIGALGKAAQNARDKSNPAFSTGALNDGSGNNPNSPSLLAKAKSLIGLK